MEAVQPPHGRTTQTETPMIGYVTIGVSDMDKAKAFYTELLADMGAELMMDMGRIAFIGTAMDAPMLAVCIPHNEDDAQPGNGNMFAIDPGSKENVDKMYHKAIELGASCDGEPGQRMPDVFYGAYIRDPDGNKVAFYQFG
jgi:predicted lactoylglutathione lyase